MGSRLRAVAPNEKAPPKPKSVAEAAKSGDNYELLVAMRDRIASTVSGDCPPRDLAALTRRLQDIGREIEAIEHRRREDGEHGLGDVGGSDEWDEEAI